MIFQTLAKHVHATKCMTAILVTIALLATSAPQKAEAGILGGALAGAVVGSLIGGKKGAKTGAIIGGIAGALRK